MRRSWRAGAARGLALLGMKLHGEHVVARRRRTRTAPRRCSRRRQCRARRDRRSSCARSRSGCPAVCPATGRGPRSARTSFQPMCGTLSRRALRVQHAFGGKPPDPARQQAESGVSPSSLFSNSICRPMQMPRNGFSCAAATTAARSPRASISRMQSGMAPLPGKTTRAAPTYLVRIARYRHREARRHVLDRFRHRAQVAHSVVDDRDVGHDCE